MNVIIKPGGRNAIQALQASILALISALPVSRKFSAAWISVTPSVDQIPSDGHQCYVSLMQEMYALASASAGAFLLRTYSQPPPQMERVRTHALLHVLAFIRGHSGASAIDIQTTLPSLVTACWMPDVTSWTLP
ncbi:hypothetical protein OG21DRAFT_259678 [Imleria badia]|nr:hypothetical protein OG21DRAFT_259678 [Imleria badia]